MGIRKELKAMAEDHGVRFSYMPLFIKAVSMALQHYPTLNASVDEKCENITYLVSNHNYSVFIPQALLLTESYCSIHILKYYLACLVHS